MTGVNPSARSLAYLTLRRRVASTLDVGTGSGIQALLAARHSGSVAAVDLNPRALAYLRLNLRLNGVENVEPLEGSWFEPVRGRRFELVVANPPYVVSPESEHLFKDSGLTGDAASRLVVEQLPAHLEEGGVGQVICNWAHAADEDWRAPVEAWVAGRGVDALLLHYETVDPLEYASTWNRSLAHAPAELGAALDRWVAYDARLGIERISWGMVVLRRRSARRNRVRAIEVPGWPRRGGGAQLERMLAAWDAPVDGEELEASVLRPVEGASSSAAGSPARQAGLPAARAPRWPGTVGFDLTLDDRAAAVVGALDGRMTSARRCRARTLTRSRWVCSRRCGASTSSAFSSWKLRDLRASSGMMGARTIGGGVMSEHEQRTDGEVEAEDTIRDLDVPADHADDVTGGAKKKAEGAEAGTDKFF